MAELTTLARPYAKAAFEFAREKNSLSEWSSSLGLVAELAKNKDVARLFDTPKLTTDQKAAVLMDVCGDMLAEKVKTFIRVLAENKRLGLIQSIQTLFESLKAQQEKFSDVELISAFALDSQVEKALAEKLKTVLLSDVSISTKLDPSLLGGVIMRSGDTVIDASIKGRLNKLAEAFRV